MKYIRTKDGIYEDAGTDAIGLRCVRYRGNVIALSEEDDKIVKEADTIEELFDLVVLKSKETGRIHGLYENSELATICEGNDILRYEIIGAIETERGIIYAAKMNDEKGEWELL